MQLDRELQLSILTELKKHYPNEHAVELLLCYQQERSFNANILYLEEYGLVAGSIVRHTGQDNFGPEMVMSRITAAGLDFLEDDGGLCAILNPIPVRIDRADLQDLIVAHLCTNEFPQETKNDILAALHALPNEHMQQFCKKLIAHGLEKAPDAVELLQQHLLRSD
jgi:hypothetical protein